MIENLKIICTVIITLAVLAGAVGIIVRSDERLNTAEIRLTDHEGRIRYLEARSTEIQADLRHIRNSLTRIEERLDGPRD